MNMTVFTDASYCPTTRAAGWSAWVKADGWDHGVFISGPMKTKFASSNEAEVSAIANALTVLSSGGHLADVAFVMLQSDCLRALAIINKNISNTRIRNHNDAAKVPLLGKEAQITSAEKKALSLIGGIVKKHCLTIGLRHVRGHRSGPSRQWVNNECDRLARQHMMSVRSTGGN